MARMAADGPVFCPPSVSMPPSAPGGSDFVHAAKPREVAPQIKVKTSFRAFIEITWGEASDSLCGSGGSTCRRYRSFGPVPHRRLRARRAAPELRDLRRRGR